MVAHQCAYWLVPLLVATTAILFMVTAMPVLDNVNEEDLLIQEEEDELSSWRASDMVCGIQGSSLVCSNIDLSDIQFDEQNECVTVEGGFTRCSRSFSTN
jgi:hypothetical protein